MCCMNPVRTLPVLFDEHGGTPREKQPSPRHPLVLEKVPTGRTRGGTKSRAAGRKSKIILPPARANDSASTTCFGVVKAVTKFKGSSDKRRRSHADQHTREMGKLPAVVRKQWKVPSDPHAAALQAKSDGLIVALYTVMDGKGPPPDPRGASSEVLNTALPSATDLSSLPDLQAVFTRIAVESLRRYFYPRLLLARALARRRERERVAVVPPMTTAHLRRQSLFKNWPTSALDAVVERVVPSCFASREFILYENEQTGSGLYFVADGTVSVLKKRNRREKAISEGNTILLATVDAFACVGEMSFLTEETRMASVVAQTAVNCWVLRKRDYEECVKDIPRTVYQSVIDNAFAARKRNMHLMFPLNDDTMTRYSIFQACPPVMLADIVKCAVALSLPKNVRLCQRDTVADRLFFLQHGVCGVLCKDRDGSEAVFHTMRAPHLIGDTAVLHNSLNPETIITLTTCDLWEVRKDKFDAILKRYPSARTQILSRVSTQKQGQQVQQSALKECVYAIPILRHLCTKETLRELLPHFKSTIYRPHSLVCSTTEYANRLVIVLKGRVKVGDTGMWARGECMGFTSVVPHRWSQMAIASDIVETYELPLHEYEAFLSRHGIYKRVVGAVRRLMFPFAHPVEKTAEVQAMVSSQRTPPLYPISESASVNLSEMGFSPQYFQHLKCLSAGPSPDLSDLVAGLSPREHRQFNWMRVSSFLWKRAVPDPPPTEGGDLMLELRKVGKRSRPSPAPSPMLSS